MVDWIGLDWIGLDWIGLDWIGNIPLTHGSQPCHEQQFDLGQQTRSHMLIFNIRSIST